MAPPSTLDRLVTRGASIVDGSVRLSAAATATATEALAGSLAASGVRQGDVVSWQLPTCHESVLLFHACWRLGAVAAPLHHRAGPAEIDHQLSVLAPAALLAAPDLPAATHPDAMLVRGDGAFEAMAAPASALAASAAAVRPDDRALILFTSGSTSVPKAAVHLHGPLAGKAASMVTAHGLGPDDVVLVPAPLAHVSGLLNGVLVPAAAGMTTVLMERWSPPDALGLIEEERVTFMAGPPTFFHGLLDLPELTPERVATLRLVSSGGANVTPAFVERAASGLRAVVKRTYGSTEAPTVTTWCPGDPPERAATADGRALDGVELRVVDPETSTEMSAGEVGELWVRGPEVFAGYLAPHEALGPDADGWFGTGDLASIDADGWLTVVGRSGRTIIRGGENIAPGEVEAALEAHPAVRRAAAVGLPHDRLGEVVGAAVVADGGLDVAACAEWFAARGLARFKVPERVVVVDELPLLPTGKPDLRAVAELFAIVRSEP